MASLLDFQIREEGGDAALESQDAVNDLLAVAGEEVPLDEFGYARLEEPVRVASTKTTAGGSSDGEISKWSPPRDDASFSRDLIDTYFRHMGNDPWLSREEEVALAKRIEAGQRAVLTRLCRIPMLVERIQEWGNALRQSKLRLRDLVDLSLLGDELLLRGNDNEVVNAAVEGEPRCTGGDHDVKEIETISSPGNKAHSVRLVDREARLTPGVLARLATDFHRYH